MNYRSGVVTGIVCSLLVVGAGFAAWRLVTSKHDAAKAEPKPAPATVAKTLKEESINAITLSQEAVDKLALRTAPVERKSVARARVYGGEVAIPAGRTTIVTAPLSGILRASSAGMPQPGRSVKKGETIVELLPLMTPEGKANLAATKIDADGQVKTARTAFNLARVAVDRARAVFEREAGSRRAVDEAQAAYDQAQQTLEAVVARQELLEKVVGEIERGTAAPIALESPQEGLLRSVSALPGQTIAPGGVIFEVADLRRVWVRVPVPVGDLPEINVDSDASVGELTGRTGKADRAAKPIPAPPSADPIASTVDRFYELDNADHRYSPGQRVGVTLALRTDESSLTVPWKAVVHDIYGGTWVYVQTGERAFERRRVVVRHVTGETAVLQAGLDEHARVVADGAIELFGAETGFTK